MTPMLSIVYFARLKDEIKLDKELIAYTEHVHTVDDVRQILILRGSVWEKAFKKPLLYAVNHHMVNLEHPIKEGDEIAFFPPVTGG